MIGQHTKNWKDFGTVLMACILCFFIHLIHSDLHLGSVIMNDVLGTKKTYSCFKCGTLLNVIMGYKKKKQSLLLRNNIDLNIETWSNETDKFIVDDFQ